MEFEEPDVEFYGGEFKAAMERLKSAFQDSWWLVSFPDPQYTRKEGPVNTVSLGRGRYGGGGGVWGGGAPPPLVLNLKKSPADITYDCRGKWGPTSTIALAANSSLQVNMTVLS